MPPPVLEVTDLRTYFRTARGEARAVDGVSLRLERGEALGLVGESGCGKSVTALSLVQLVPQPPGRILPGSSVCLHGEELLGAPESRLREVRGGEIGFVFQEPMTSLNPVLRVGDQVAEAVRRHRGLEGSELTAEVTRLLDRVGIPEPDRRRRAYPHQLSGGMRQRVMIAMAVSCRPSLLIADEPTTALDVTIQAQILDLLDSLRAEYGMSLLFISHDLAVVARIANRVSVMYAGQVVETGDTRALFRGPLHPYAEGLMLAVPDPDRRRERLEVIPGRVPHPTAWPAGCRYHERCPYRWDRCRGDAPSLLASPVSGSRAVRCWLLEEPDRRRTAGYGVRFSGGRS